MRLFATPSYEEWMFLGIIFFLVAVLITTAEIIRRLLDGGSEITRKFVHIIVGILMVCAPYLFESGVPAVMISAIMVIITFLSIRFDFLKSLHASGRTSYGTTYHPLAFLILVLLFWDSSPTILSISILILAVPDALAAIAGQYISSPKFLNIGDDKKTIEGTVTMFVSTAVCIFASLQFFNVQTEMPIIILAIVTSLFATGWELISFKGSDNISVPLGTAFMLHYFFTAIPHHHPGQMVTATVLASIIGIISYRLKYLSLSGSIATFLLATIIYGIGGWEWTVPIFVFFIASSLLSKYGKSRKRRFELMFDKSDKRDAGQVAANGGIAGIIILVWYLFPERTELYLFYLGAIAAVTADTWGTEIGTLMKGKPRSIVTFKTVEPGTSGGVSAAGLAGGIAGALLIVLSASMVRSDLLSVFNIAAVVFAGFAGSIVDSILGATLQAQYQTPEGKRTERAIVNGMPTQLILGYRWMTNDIVNWLCALSGAAIMYFLL